MLRALRFAIPVLAGLGHAQVALADCAAPYTTDQLLTDMIAVEEALRANDAGTAAASGKQLKEGIACLNEVLPGMMVGRTYRAIGAGFLAGGDEGAARKWFATSVEVDGGFDYGVEDLPADSEVRSVYQDLKIAFVPAAETLEGQTFGAGTHWLDGRKISEPTAVQSRPHLYQKEAGAVQSWIIQGNAFPEAALGGGSAEEGKKGKKDKTAKPEPGSTVINEFGFVERVRPPEKTPLLVGGIVTMIGAGAVYGYSALTRAEFDDCTSKECVEEKKGLTNSLVLASGGVLVAGVAALTWGVMVDDNGTAIPTVRVRF